MSANARIDVRPARPADRDVWVAMRTALWPDGAHEHAAEVDRFFAEPDPRWEQGALLAWSGETAVGFVEVSVRPSAEGCESRHVGYVEGWYVAPPARRTGVGRALVRAAEGWSSERGCVELASDTEPENVTSRDAHVACGFEDAGLVRCFRKPIGER